jgi:hypothetical protein
MRSIIKTGILLFLLTASVDTMGAAMQQTGEGQLNDTVLAPMPGKLLHAATDAVLVPDTDTLFNNIDTKYKAAVSRLKLQAAILEKYLAKNNYNTEYCFLVDMSIPSGKKRFFVYNLKKDSVELSAMVTHGYRSYEYNCNDQLLFSNTPYSFKTSIGRYKIGQSYYGNFGLAYKLYGLDSTNNKAYERAIVLHAHKHVPDTEMFPERIMESTGCPVVSPLFLAILNKYIKASKKPMLMWIYN